MSHSVTTHGSALSPNKRTSILRNLLPSEAVEGKSSSGSSSGAGSGGEGHDYQSQQCPPTTAQSTHAPLQNIEEDVIHEEEGRARTLTVLPLAAFVFYSVSGGPFGIEGAVVSSSPFHAILGFLIMPFFWCLPEALITAELSTAFPVSAGSVAW
jgi:hypothetical protein